MSNSIKYFLFVGFFYWVSFEAKSQEDSASFADLVPFVTTPWEVVDAILELGKVTKDDVIIDLGSGDGRIPIRAAEKFGSKGIGVEIDAELVSLAISNAEKAGVSKMVEFYQGDLFAMDFSEATVLTLYLFPDINLKLRPRILQMKSGTRIISHRFDMGDWKPDATQVITLPDGKEHVIYLWIVP